jgi:hypothetical protein
MQTKINLHVFLVLWIVPLVKISINVWLVISHIISLFIIINWYVFNNVLLVIIKIFRFTLVKFVIKIAQHAPQIKFVINVKNFLCFIILNVTLNALKVHIILIKHIVLIANQIVIVVLQKIIVFHVDKILFCI